MEWGALEQGIQVDPPSTRVGEQLRRNLRRNRSSLQLAAPGSIDLGAELRAGVEGVEIHVFVVLDGEPVGVLQIRARELAPSLPFPAWVAKSVPRGAEFVLGAVYPVGNRTSTSRISYHDDFDWQQLAPLFTLKQPGTSRDGTQKPNTDA
jgi:hypothetical protein